VAQVVTGETKLTLTNVPANFSTDPNVKVALSEAIADTIPGVEKEHVTITEIIVTRRLQDLKWNVRRLAGDVTVKHTINLPATYTGGAITSSSFKADTLKKNINARLTSKGVSVQVSALQVMKMETTAAPTAAPTATRPAVGSASCALIITAPTLPAAFICIMSTVYALGSIFSL